MTRSEDDTQSSPEAPGGEAAGGGEHDEALARLSDYYEGLLGRDEAAEVRAHLQECAACQAAYRELEQTVGALSSLGRRAAPAHFEEGVQSTLHRRSAGRFFGRRAFGDRIPLEILAVLALLLGLAVYGLLRASETGSLAPPEDGRGQDPVEHPEPLEPAPERRDPASGRPDSEGS